MDKSHFEMATTEIENDVKRLDVITKRFSKIGSAPSLTQNNVTKILDDSIAYLKPRTSKKTNYVLNYDNKNEILIPVNEELFSWVIENICKNAIDAMGGKGTITIDLLENPKNITIDISDTGKGISNSEQKSIFDPGYTSKKRGWGLGLSLSKRIIRDYHQGKLFVKTSTVGKGTTFRIVLNKKSQLDVWENIFLIFYMDML